jgi:4-hydroxy-tetrahydrodipicolinate reductase
MARQRNSPSKLAASGGLKIGIMGCAGRMGQMLVRTVAASDRCLIAGGTERPGASAVGKDIGVVAGLEAVGVAITDDAADLFAVSDAVLEFTNPAATLQHAELAARDKTIHVIGTTGFEPAQTAALGRAARQTAIVLAPNMSLGVNLLMQLVRQVARALDADWDIEVVEMHHRAKVDAPSGTALGLGRAAAEGRGVAFDAVARRGRDGMTGARRRGDIGLAALRGGDVVGDHRVIFAADGERIELGHVATSREIYARGAMRAALWAEGKPPGLYSMADVLGLKG